MGLLELRSVADRARRRSAGGIPPAAAHPEPHLFEGRAAARRDRALARADSLRRARPRRLHAAQAGHRLGADLRLRLAADHRRGAAGHHATPWCCSASAARASWSRPTARSSTASAPSGSRATCRTAAAGTVRCGASTPRPAASSCTPTSPTTASCSGNSARRSITAPTSRPGTTRRTRLYYDYLTLMVLAKATDDVGARRPAARRTPRRVRALRRRRPPRRPRGARSAAGRAVDERLRLRRRRPRPPRSGLALADPRDPAQGRAHLRPPAREHRRAPRLRLRHQPAAADAVDEGAASGPVRADEARRRRRTSRTAGVVLGRDRHEYAGRGISRAPVARRPPIPAGGVRSDRRAAAPVLACPTPSATAATCRRS